MAPEMGSILGPKLEHFRISQQGQNALIPLCFDSKRPPKGAVSPSNWEPKVSQSGPAETGAKRRFLAESGGPKLSP